MNKWGMIAASTAAMLALAGCGGAAGESAASTAASSAYKAPQKVTYEVYATGLDEQTHTGYTEGVMPYSANITYSAADGTTQQETATNSWEYDATGAGSEYISVQRDGSQTWKVVCTIKHDGTVVNTHEATGHNIATCKA